MSIVFNERLWKAPEQQINAGNLSDTLNGNILTAILPEVNKSTRLHDNIMLEMMLTQQILKECDCEFTNWPGYLQHLQVDPFAVHMYTEQGLQVLVSHLCPKKHMCPCTWMPQGLVGVVTAVPEQNKKVL